VVQAGSDIEDAIPNDQAKSVRNGGQAIYAEPSANRCEVLQGVVREGCGVRLINDFVGVAFKPSPGLNLQAIQMLFSPIQL